MKHNPSTQQSTQKPNSFFNGKNPFVRYPNKASARGAPVQVPHGLASRDQASPSFPGGDSVQAPRVPASRDQASLSSAQRDTTAHSPKPMPAVQAHASPSSPRATVNQDGILKFLLDMKYARKSQLLKRFGDNDQTRSEIGQLLRAGFIKSKDRDLTARSLLIPTLEGYKHLQTGAKGMLLAEPVKRIFDPMVRHDLILGDIRLRFEELNFIKKWNSEEMLKVVPGFAKLMRDLPDAMCERNDGNSYFLELEISPKNRKVYEDRVEEYKAILEMDEIKAQGINGVIFLCTDPKVLETLKSVTPKNTKAFSVLPITRYLKDFILEEVGV
ncbi:MAG: hypothetical protein KF681_08435 [Bdellovibrionaceae bacterium]|nr:hypothetical protein [Pseudobdellovibrionaceae bacterium]